jgi:catechol 2,3-dioxygenase-like lactoylglutathione lyase family enzyme
MLAALLQGASAEGRRGYAHLRNVNRNAPMHNIENLKKQAKLYLRWHRDGHYPVAAQIRAALPRFRDLSDHEVLRQNFKLADAQELVARQSGFENWQALKTGMHAMTDKQAPTTAAPVLNSAEASIFTTDFDASCAFFTEKLGFEVVFTYGEPPFYGQIRRVRGPVFVDDVREREELLSVSITVGTAADIRQLFLDFQAAGVDFFRPLKQQPWGARTFVVRDPDGNLLLFAGTST